MRENGSGVLSIVVNADASAVRAAESGGKPLEQAVRLSDLVDGGWRVGAWQRAKDGSATIVLSKSFDSPDDVARIVREAGGEKGPLRLSAKRSKGFVSSSYSVSGRADLQDVSTGVPTDPDLVASLSAQSVDPNAIDQQLLSQLKASFRLEVTTRVPGKTRSIVASAGAVTPVSVSSKLLNTNRIIFLIAALGFAGLAFVFWRRGGPSKGNRGRRLPHVPRPHVPHPHMPHPNLPHPNVPRPHLPHPHLPHVPSRRGGPAPPARKPPSQ